MREGEGVDGLVTCVCVHCRDKAVVVMMMI